MARLFADGPLGGRPVVEAEGDALRVDGFRGDQLLPAWQAARELVPVTGRWPVAVWGGRATQPIGDPNGERVEAHRIATERVDPWPVFQSYIDDYPISADDLREHVDYRFPASPELADRMVTDLRPPTTTPIYDRWLYDAILRDPALRAATPVDHLQGTRTWHRVEEFNLVLLPTLHGWLSPAWLDYYGAGEYLEGTHALAAAQRAWEERWGAELVASWYTMLQFVVQRPPRDPEDAWTLAGQLKAVGGSLQMYQYELALALPSSNAWFLHDRP